MKDKQTKEPKSKKKEPVYIPIRQYNNAEVLELGEIRLSSEYLRCDALISLALSILKDKNVQKYLGLIEKKKHFGGYAG